MEIRADRLFLFLRAVMVPGRSNMLKAMGLPGVLSSPLSAKRIRKLVGQEVNWVNVCCDTALGLLGDVCLENRDRIGHMVLNGAPVWGYIDATYPELLSLFTQVASGEITEEMLKETPRQLLKQEDLVRFGP